MCNIKCSACKTKIRIGKIFLDALFNVETKPIQCESCKNLIKLEYSSSIISVAIVNAIIIPLFFRFELSLLQIILSALLYTPLVGFLFICSVKIKKG